MRDGLMAERAYAEPRIGMSYVSIYADLFYSMSRTESNPCRSVCSMGF